MSRFLSRCSFENSATAAAADRIFDGVDYWFCSAGYAEAFDADPNTYPTKERAR